MSDTKSVLKQIAKEARPLIEQWLDLSEQFSLFREAATTHGLDWSAIKALVKAQVQDERGDDDGKRVKKIIERADFATAYADMLGLGTNMNEKNISSDAAAGRRARSKRRLSEAMDDNKALSAEMRDAGLISEEAHAENMQISDAVARKLGAGVLNPEPEPEPSHNSDTGEIYETPSAPHGAADAGGIPAKQTLPESVGARDASADPSDPGEIPAFLRRVA